MFDAAKSLVSESLFVQKTYRRYVQPHLPQYEPETYILKRLKFDECLDVGAHAGTYSILLSKNSNRVYAFEPTAHSFRILQSLNLKNVTTYNLALGDKSGEGEVSLPIVDGNVDYALASLRTLSINEYPASRKQKIRIVKLDEFKDKIDFSKIDFVKIDVEGFEMQVLLGMQDLLRSKKPELLIEIEQRHNTKYNDVFEFLEKQSYEPYVTSDGVTLKKITVADVPSLQSTENLRADGARKFRPGERKKYINNFFFLQPRHKAAHSAL